MNRYKKSLQAARISAMASILASMVLLLFRRGDRVDQFMPLALSISLGALAWLTLFVRRSGQGHVALGVYSLTIGGATMVLPWLLVSSYGQNDPNLLLLF